MEKNLENYKNKYIKYKNKYLKLKSKNGGNWLKSFLENKKPEDLLGQGGFGKVFKFKYEEKDYVVKQMKFIRKKKDISSLIKKEYRFLKSIRYPFASYSTLNLLKDDNFFYISMNNIKGSDGIDYYNNNYGLFYKNINNSLFFFMQMVFINYYLHTNGLVHLDIKLDNYMIEEINGVPYLNIIDFGLSRCLKKSVKSNFCPNILYNSESININTGTPIYQPFSMLDNDSHLTSYNDDYYLITILFFLIYTGIIGSKKYNKIFELRDSKKNYQFFNEFYHYLKSEGLKKEELLKYFIIEQKYRYFEFIQFLNNKLEKKNQIGGNLKNEIFFDKFRKNINNIVYLDNLINSENVNLIDDQNNSLIQLAIINNASSDVIDLLIKKGVNLNVKDINNNNLLNLAILSKRNIIKEGFKKINQNDIKLDKLYMKYDNSEDKLENRIEILNEEIKRNYDKIEKLNEIKISKKNKIAINSLKKDNQILENKINLLEKEKDERLFNKIRILKPFEKNNKNIRKEINNEIKKLKDLLIILINNNVDKNNINNDGKNNYNLYENLISSADFRLDNNILDLLASYGINSKDYHRFMAKKALNFFKNNIKTNINLDNKLDQIFDYIDTFHTSGESFIAKKTRLIIYFNELVKFNR